MDHRPVTIHQKFDEIVTGFFDMGTDYVAYRPGGTNDFLLFYTLAGRGRFNTGGEPLIVHPNEIVLLPPGTVHDYTTDPVTKRWKFLWAHFVPRVSWLELLDWPVETFGLMRLPPLTGSARKVMGRQFARVHRSSLTTGPLRTPLAMNAMERLLLMCATHNPRHAARRIDPAMRRVMDHIAAHLADPMPIDALADIAGLSVSRFGHRFREVVDCPPVLFVERLRIDRAKALLRMTSLSIKEISHQVGFSGPFYFSLRFKKNVGLSPSAYRDSAAD